MEKTDEIGIVFIIETKSYFFDSHLGMGQEAFALKDYPVLDNVIRCAFTDQSDFFAQVFRRHKQQFGILSYGVVRFVVLLHQFAEPSQKLHIRLLIRIRQLVLLFPNPGRLEDNQFQQNPKHFFRAWVLIFHLKLNLLDDFLDILGLAFI